ncbi:MAG TPA: universal stress protein, partial [Polyangiaceae bacterium]|nr:universal stress protein [Polyangiaceae bacterium]
TTAYILRRRAAAVFDRIIVPVDFSEGSRSAFGHGAAFAQAFGSVLELVHVVQHVGQTHPAFWTTEPALAGELHRQALTLAETSMQQLLPHLPATSGVQLQTRILSGSLPGTLSEHAAETHAGLLVVASHGRTGISRWLLGSVSERLLRSAPCPVLIVRGGSASDHPRLRRVLVAVDLSEHSRHALEVAGKVASGFGAALEVLYVWAAPFYDAAEHFDADLFERIRQSARAELDAFVASAGLPPDVAVSVSIASGTPAQKLGERLQADAPDLLVLGSHGHGGFKRLILGSVAETTVRYASCAALVVPKLPAESSRPSQPHF